MGIDAVLDADVIDGEELSLVGIRTGKGVACGITDTGTFSPSGKRIVVDPLIPYPDDIGSPDIQFGIRINLLAQEG